MSDYPYSLEPYKSMANRFHCPSCNQSQKTFVRYINNQTGEHIHSTVGKCNSESYCGYHYTPKQYFQENNISYDKTLIQHNKPKPIQSKPTSYINPDTFKASLKNYKSNNFIDYLLTLFGKQITEQLISKYYIGTSKYWKGSTVFWQVDSFGKIRSGKIMLYNSFTGKKLKKNINWVHSVLKLPDFQLKQCLFGEHLIINNKKPIAIVESEKTAIVASIYLPGLTWLAAGSIHGLNEEKCKILRNRQVILFPDINAYHKWKTKAQQLSHITNFQISDLLERNSTSSEKIQSLDLEDFLKRYNYTHFLNPDPEPTNPNQLPIIQPIQQIKTNQQPVSKPSFIFPPDKLDQYIAALEKKYSNPI